MQLGQHQMPFAHQYDEIYESGNCTQTFVEVVCDKGVRGHPCRFIDKPSVCVQRWSYVPALVKWYNAPNEWGIDFIKLRSGCSCLVERPKC
ncbi:unnamed protein product [Larinioides sclopetarius]|uniref:Spaetzle domain-containing protein n=1 Tax=Larinioides sclopetarius TaxID=280406 RepID=A0AAV2AS79_9ARAC